MTIDPDKDVKATAIEACSRVESSLPAGKSIKDHGIDVCPRPVVSPARRDEKHRTIEEREEEMVTLARDHILTCGDFLLVQDLANHLGIHVELLSPALKEWEADHRIFSIDHDGCKFFPAYAFPSQGGASPIPGLRDVLSVLCPMKDGWGVSFWFISPNGWLGGKCPQDLLSTEPSRVVSAAHEEASGVMHG
ncbi:hypothetical protein PS726_04634 [Pseudomonas fluorescens]|uniref:hypothetical protein n=1 Tax=Pseudomonas fluorescens TaxID=294 RepID=UPI001241BB6D|nr:hypothetical protein [Pseudomonas fluorescens]VVO26491.1 hypothetical protein PS726_04634 [Pseudomonas fluorescens]